jgi:hypothetical protein
MEDVDDRSAAVVTTGKDGLGQFEKSHISSSPSVGRREANWSTTARRCASKSSTSDFRLCQSMNERDRAIVAMRFRTWLATAVGLSGPANSRRNRRFAGAFPSLISISS